MTRQPQTLREISVYPIKSGAGIAVESRAVTPRGLLGDRRWMVVSEDGRFLTARRHPRLVLVRSRELEDGALELSAPGLPSLTVPRPQATERGRIEVVIWQSELTVSDAGDEAADWLGEHLGASLEGGCRLVHQQDEDLRSIEEWPGVEPTDTVSLADGYPLLLIGSASLDALNRRLDRPVTMRHFRPNLVVETEVPFEEDDWRMIRVGDCEFVGVKRCARCVMTTVDPQTAEKDPATEPMRTLQEFRFEPERRGILFGMNLIPRATGRISVGDPIEVRDAATD